LEIRRDRPEQAEDFLKKPTRLLPQRRFGGVGGIDRSVQSQSGSAAEDEAEKEAHAESDAHGLKRVRSDVGFGFALIILSVGRGVAVNRLRAAAKLVGFRAGLVTDVSVGSAGRFAEVLGGGTQMLASGVIGGLGVFFHGFLDAATEAGRAVGETVKKHAKSAYDAGREHLGAAAKDLGEAASASYGDIRDQARTKADEFRGRAQSVYSDASAYAQDYQSEAEAYIRSNPLQSVGIALGVGFLFGLILRR